MLSGVGSKSERVTATDRELIETFIDQKVAELERAFEPRKIIQDDEAYGLFVLADVGLGEYRDESVAVVAKVVGYGDFGDDARRVEFIEIPYCTNSKNEIIFAGDLVNLVGKLSNATLLVDNGGVGATLNKLIEASGVPVVRVNWGKPCFKKEYQDRFYNRISTNRALVF